MNYYYQKQRNPFGDLKSFFTSGSVLRNLILINVAVWILISVLMVFAFLFNASDGIVASAITEYFAVPAYLPTLFIRPWTLASYMFLHINFFHILFNMLWLFWFGQIFLQYLNSRQLLAVYLWGGLAGALLYILAYNIFPVFSADLPISRALGASASVMAIVTAISFYVPNYTINLLFIGRIRILYLAIALFVIDFFMIRSSNSGGHIAHIGGFIYGYLYIFFLKKGRDIGGIFRINLKSFTKPFLKEKKNKPKSGFRYERPLSDEEFNEKKKNKEERIDAILDKISKHGYDHLTKEEKEFLFRSGNK